MVASVLPSITKGNVMNALLPVVLGNLYYVGGGSLGLLILIIVVVVLLRR